MQTYSTTQASNLATFVGLIVLVFNHFHINIGSDEVTLFIGSVIAAGGLVINWYHRYKKGDLTALGARKV